MATPTLKLPAKLEAFLAAQVEQGAYRSREAAIIAAVASEQRRAEQRSWLHAEIQKGLDSGPAGPLDIEDLLRRGRRRLAGRKPRHPAG